MSSVDQNFKLLDSSNSEVTATLHESDSDVGPLPASNSYSIPISERSQSFPPLPDPLPLPKVTQKYREACAVADEIATRCWLRSDTTSDSEYDANPDPPKLLQQIEYQPNNDYANITHAAAYSRTESACLDLFYASTNAIDNGGGFGGFDYPKHLLIRKLRASWTEDPLLTIKLIFNLGNVRGSGSGPGSGKQDRANFYRGLLWLFREHPRSFLAGQNVALIAKHSSLQCLLDVLSFAIHDDEHASQSDVKKSNHHRSDLDFSLNAHQKKVMISKHRAHIKATMGNINGYFGGIRNSNCTNLNATMQDAKKKDVENCLDYLEKESSINGECDLVRNRWGYLKRFEKTDSSSDGVTETVAANANNAIIPLSKI